jgi:hypothetical protein
MKLHVSWRTLLLLLLLRFRPRGLAVAWSR